MYRPTDPNCCASGTITERYQFNGATLLRATATTPTPTATTFTSDAPPPAVTVPAAFARVTDLDRPITDPHVRFCVTAVLSLVPDLVTSRRLGTAGCPGIAAGQG